MFPISVWILIIVSTVLSMAVILTIDNLKLSPTRRMILTGLALMAILYTGVFAASYVLAQKTLPAQKTNTSSPEHRDFENRVNGALKQLEKMANSKFSLCCTIVCYT